MNYLITGHNGFIGKNLWNHVESSSTSITGIDMKFLDDPMWSELLESYVIAADIIFHIGAISDVSLQDYNKMLKYNFEFSKVLFDCASKYNKRVIYSSSSSVYGNEGLPENIYAWSKYLAEQYGIRTVKNFVALRYFNVYGPHENLKGCMQSLVKHIYESDIFKIFPVKAKRDFIYVKDVVDANIHAISARPGIYDVGTGNAYPYEDICDILDKDYEYENILNVPKGYQAYTCADKHKFMNTWRPQFTLEQGVLEYKEYLDGSNDSN